MIPSTVSIRRLNFRVDWGASYRRCGLASFAPALADSRLVVRVDAAAITAHDSPQPDEKGRMVQQPIGTLPARRQRQPPRMVRDGLRRSRSRQRNRRTIPNPCNRIFPRRASLREHGRQCGHCSLVPSHGVSSLMSVECTLPSHRRTVAGMGVGEHGTRASFGAAGTLQHRRPLCDTGCHTTLTSERHVSWRPVQMIHCRPVPGNATIPTCSWRVRH
jgi:hypothetical protein